jgi:hypothetical protein
MNIFCGMAAGMLSAGLVVLGIIFIKWADATCGLPEKTNIIFPAVSCICGRICGRIFEIRSVIPLALLTAYIYISAYTDYYTMQLYTIFSVAVFIVGIVMQYLTMHDICCFEMALFVILVVFSRLSGAINTGDVYLLAALAPWLALYGYITGFDAFTVMSIFYLISLVTGILINIRKVIKIKHYHVPFAVPVAIVYFLGTVLLFGLRTGGV